VNYSTHYYRAIVSLFCKGRKVVRSVFA